MKKSTNKFRVCMVQRVVTDYRLHFLRELHAHLLGQDVDLTVIGGHPWPGEGLCDALRDAPNAVQCPNIRVAGKGYWLSGVMHETRHADLVILEQASSALHNYPLIVGRPRQKTAFFGHGATLDRARPRPVRDAWKRFWARRVDWWFAYTSHTAEIVRAAGFPPSRITVVNNATDTRALRAQRERLGADDMRQTESKLFVGAYDKGPSTRPRPTGIFCGRLVPLKWIPFLLEAADHVKALLPDFRLIIVGDGPERDRVVAFCASRSWCAYAGARYGAELARVAALADVWMNPGMLGLAVVDAFALGLPVASTTNGIHSPEIAYLESGRNGLLSDPEVGAYGDAVAALLRDGDSLAALSAEAWTDGEKYTAEDMADRFARGICKALTGSR